MVFRCWRCYWASPTGSGTPSAQFGSGAVLILAVAVYVNCWDPGIGDWALKPRRRLMESWDGLIEVRQPWKESGFTETR
jgi:hypothetical protein